MTRQAVAAGFERFLDDAIETTAAEFSLSAALQSSTDAPSGPVADKLLANSERVHSHVVQPELDVYRTQLCEQFEVTLDYAESDESVDAFRDEILAADAFATRLRAGLPTTESETVRAALLDHHRQLGDAVTPLVDSPEPSFWNAAVAELTAEEAVDLVETHFAFTAPLRAHADAFHLETTVELGDVLGGLASFLPISTLDVEYTHEALRAMTHAEREVIATTKTEIRDRFD